MGQWRYVWVTLLPLAWLVSVTMTASAQKIFHPNPEIGFWANARQLSEQVAAGSIAADKVVEAQRLIFNYRLDAVVTGVFALLVLLILIESARHWCLYALGRRQPVLNEAPMVLSRITA